METTFYLKYRPQKFSELDSTEAREELQKIFSSGKIPHAFLFCGPKGIGKTSAARIVAKAVNCEENELGRHVLNKGLATDRQKTLIADFEPCNHCDNCLSITAGTGMDVLEMDAASNRGIEDIKELRENIKLAPSKLRFKVYIIDEVHMLTTEAFNALLKTLEEPPPHTIFILCTTDPEKLPKTIVSRCLVVNFKKATKKEIVGRLKKICEAENLEYEEKALEEIVKVSEGSFRDANKILEQVSFSGKITAEEVKKVVGLSAQFEVVDFLELLKKKETREALFWINKAFEQGLNLKILTENILDVLRAQLLKKFGIEVESEQKELGFSIEEIKRLIELFTQAYQSLRSTAILQLPLEMAVIEWDVSGDQEDGKPNEQRKVREEQEGSGGRKQVEEKVQREEEKESFDFSQSVGNLELEKVVEKWPEILEGVKPLNHSVLAFLKAAKPLECKDGFLTLEVFYKFHKDQLEKETSRRIFEKVASEVLGGRVKLKCRLGEGKKEKLSEKLEQEEVKKTDSLKSDSDIIELAEKIFSN